MAEKVADLINEREDLLTGIGPKVRKVEEEMGKTEREINKFLRSYKRTEGAKEVAKKILVVFKKKNIDPFQLESRFFDMLQVLSGEKISWKGKKSKFDLVEKN